MNNNRVKIEIKVLNGLKNGNIKQFYASGKKQTIQILKMENYLENLPHFMKMEMNK